MPQDECSAVPIENKVYDKVAQSRTREIFAGKKSQPAAESQPVTSKEGPSNAARDGKKQIVQDMPSTSTTETGRPGEHLSARETETSLYLW